MIIPYIMGAILGRTFNYVNMTTGADIFTQQEINSKTQVINTNISEARYSMVESLDDVLDSLNIQGELRIKVASGKFGLDGAGQYYKRTREAKNTVELLYQQTYETVTETLDTSIEPKARWNEANKAVLGSYFVRSITYGGQLIASLKLKAENSEDAKTIKARLELGIGLGDKGGLDIKGYFEQIKNSVKKPVSMTIDFYATTAVEGVPHTIEGFTKLVGQFNNDIEKVANGKGNPIKMELAPLKLLTTGSNIGLEVKNAAVGSQLAEVSERFSDVRDAKAETEQWVEELENISDTEASIIGNFYSDVTTTNSLFLHAMDGLDLTPTASSDQFALAMTAYTKDGKNLPGKFSRGLQYVIDSVMNLRSRCLSSMSTNKFLFESNLRNTGQSVYKAENSVNLQRCITACEDDPKCHSLTFISTSATSSGKCFVNQMELGQSQHIAVPSNGHAGLNVYFIQKGIEFCSAIE